MRLYGRNSVIERLRSNPQTIKRVYIEEDSQHTSYFRKKAKQFGVAVVSIPKSKMIKIARNLNTQGILADVDDFIYLTFNDLLDKALEKRLTIVFLDGLNDPQNLGAIIRSLGFLGKFSIVIPTHDSVQITEAVLRVASGGDNYVPVARVSNLVNVIKQAKEAGFTIAGSVVKDAQPLDEIQFPFPLGLVLGSEEKGIRDIIRLHLDLEVTIPMVLTHLSLNVAQAATIFAYEINKQKKARK